MIKWKLITLLLFISISAYSQSDSLKPITYYYENGEISSSGFLRDGKPDGYWKSYYVDGTIKTEGNRVDFKLDGPWKFYDENGQIAVIINYSLDKKNGFKDTYKEGYLFKREEFIDDFKQNFTTLYYANGQIEKLTPFVNNKEHGNGYSYDTTGLIVGLQTYKLGVLVKNQSINFTDKTGFKQGLWMEFHNNLNVKSEGPYKDNLKHGFWKYYKPNGNLIRIEKWVMGVLQEDADNISKVDVRREIDPRTGKLKYLGSYVDGVKEGVQREYDADGNVVASWLYSKGILLAEGIYDELGRKQDEWKYYWPDGSIKATGKYKDDKRIQEWKYFFADGKVEQYGVYINDKPEGLWQWYFQNGELRKEENYEGGLKEGLSKEYNDTGFVLVQGEYVEDLKEGRWVYIINNTKEEGTYFAGDKQGEWKRTNLITGRLLFEGSYTSGQADGLHITYYDNGRIHRRGKYVMGVREGIWEIFDELGRIILTITYKNGKEIEYNGVKITYGKRIDRELAEEEAE